MNKGKMMKCVVAIKGLSENTYFVRQAMKLFDEIVYLENRPSRTELITALESCDVLIIGAKEKINSSEILESTSLPKIIGTLSVGLDHLDLNELQNQGVIIINAPTANVNSVAEHVICMALSLLKDVKSTDRLVQDGLGRDSVSRSPRELAGKTLGIVGYGNIAKRTAAIATCMGVNVIASSKTRVSGSDGDVVFETINELFSISDIVSLSLPLTNETEGLVSANLLKLMKKGSILINTSRPEIVDHHSIMEALSTETLAGFSEDGDTAPDFLRGMDNVIFTPHLAGLTTEASDRLDNELIDRISEYLN